ncbi:hypothetical protein PC117_g12150 [Phytophthora cactorum]|uniref:Uncharacterized protein n=1 Tax=Phytophthora cactorum TaxID=29920 RepID=A0A8T1D999_9STRA|nr:hypothetical protein PC117_g12150 [Phytophthora cactorum]
MSDVLLMVASGSTTSRVYDYTRDNSPHQVQIQDVDNLIGMIKKSDNSMTDEDQVAALLVEFNMDAEGNVAGVKDDSRGQSAVGRMRKVDKEVRVWLFTIPDASIQARWLRYGNLGEDLVDVNVPIRIRKADTVVKRLQ